MEFWISFSCFIEKLLALRYTRIHLVFRKWELTKQSKPLKIKSKILSNLFSEKYKLKLGEFINTTGNERVKRDNKFLSYPGYVPYLRTQSMVGGL